jgi:hypothetical protein
MTKCETCGAELQDGSQRFCGGDRCGRVFMKHPQQGTATEMSPRWNSKITWPPSADAMLRTVSGTTRRGL